MTKQILIFFLLFFIIFSIKAQDNIVVIGKITDATTGIGIENVHVKILQKNIITKSDEKGNYHVSFHKTKLVTLVFSHTSYEVDYEPINTLQDTLFLDVQLKSKIVELPEFNADDKDTPVPVFRSAKISIEDYEFYQNQFLFLVYGKRLDKDSEIYLVDEDENIISKHFIPGEPVELYTDYLGHVNLICKTAIYRVEVQKERIVIYELPMDDFNQLIKPIVDTLKGNIIFSDFLKQFPRFKYYAFNPTDTSVSIIKEVVHKDMDWQYGFEYYNLNNADKQFAKRMAKRIKGYDKFDVAAAMTGFTNSFLYEPVYAPLFVINDTISIFDHYENKIWKFIKDTIEVDSISISYHQPAKKSEWKNQLIMDEVNGKIYGVFLRNGYYYLKEININTGEIVAEKKLFYQYVSKIKIKDGFVYYTYKPSQTLQKKFLYKERIN
ncbi:MAG: hypothetical protein COX70_02380 [Flavobacteriales bacterium CG_4_10_14_0_2_um_filter_32_8]|nr:MAG: hypothetical protein COX70_02380 [Flavobacteriales bacterium CG_4_10_14_0_2_um_filter_32_8]